MTRRFTARLEDGTFAGWTSNDSTPYGEANGVTRAEILAPPAGLPTATDDFALKVTPQTTAPRDAPYYAISGGAYELYGCVRMNVPAAPSGTGTSRSTWTSSRETPWRIVAAGTNDGIFVCELVAGQASGWQPKFWYGNMPEGNTNLYQVDNLLPEWSLAYNTWYKIDWHIRIRDDGASGGTHPWTVFVDCRYDCGSISSENATFTWQDSVTVDFSMARFHVEDSASNWTVWMDDFVINDTAGSDYNSWTCDDPGEDGISVIGDSPFRHVLGHRVP